MRPLARIPFLAAAVVALSTCGCALTSKADLVGTRYFTPEVPAARLNGADAAGHAGAGAPAGSALELRLGRISSGAHLRERIAYRDAAYEVGYYEDQRWTERPEIYVRRQILRTLFEGRTFKRVLGGTAPTLEIDVVAFDELRLPSGGAARVQLKVVLFEERNVLFEETVTVDRPIAAGAGRPRIEEVVGAMAQALDLAAEQVALRVAAAAKAPGAWH